MWAVSLQSFFFVRLDHASGVNTVLSFLLVIFMGESESSVNLPSFSGRKNVPQDKFDREGRRSHCGGR